MISGKSCHSQCLANNKFFSKTLGYFMSIKYNNLSSLTYTIHTAQVALFTIYTQEAKVGILTASGRFICLIYAEWKLLLSPFATANSTEIYPLLRFSILRRQRRYSGTFWSVWCDGYEFSTVMLSTYTVYIYKYCTSVVLKISRCVKSKYSMNCIIVHVQ